MDYDDDEEGFQPRPDRHKGLLSLHCWLSHNLLLMIFQKEFNMVAALFLIYGNCKVSWLLISVIYELNASEIFANLSVWVKYLSTCLGKTM